MTSLALTELELKDRLLGAIFGAALGDAYGVAAKDSSPEVLKARSLGFPRKEPVKGYPLNDFGASTDLAVILMRTFTSSRRSGVLAPESDFAGRLIKWIQGGFAELGDTQGLGCGVFTRQVASLEDFAAAPFAAAGRAGALPDGAAVARAAPCAFMPEPERWAELACRITHADPRSSAACTAHTLLVKAMAEWRPSTVFPMKAVKAALEGGLARLGGDAAAAQEFLGWARASRQLAAVGLSAPRGQEFVYRALACSVWAARQLRAADSREKKRDAALFGELVAAAALEGGAADQNCAIVGAVAGAAVGFAGLPADWVKALPFGVWLQREAEAFLGAL